MRAAPYRFAEMAINYEETLRTFKIPITPRTRKILDEMRTTRLVTEKQLLEWQRFEELRAKLEKILIQREAERKAERKRRIEELKSSLEAGRKRLDEFGPRCQIRDAILKGKKNEQEKTR